MCPINWVKPGGFYGVHSIATDSKGNMQPAVAQWNPSGYLWNQYDSVRIEIK